MRDNTFAIDELLNAWEETYKKGQLTFWIFLALKESNKCVEDIKAFVEKASNFVIGLFLFFKAPFHPFH